MKRLPLILFLLVFDGGPALFLTLVFLLIVAGRRSARRRELRVRQSKEATPDEPS